MSTTTGIVLENIKEICHTTINFGGPAESGDGATFGVHLGSSVSFVDELYDADGKQIGTVKGTSVIFGDTDPKSVPAYGVSGRYLGLKGTRGFQLLERPDPETSLIKASLVLEG
jgi:hypothetical protein